MDVAEGVEVITQGREVSREIADGRSRTVFDVDRPVPVFSLNAGKYEKFEERIHDVDIALYLHPAHLRQVRFLRMQVRRYWKRWTRCSTPSSRRRV